MGLFTPLHKSKDPEKRMKSIKEIFDSKNLESFSIGEKIGKNDKD